jgi:hypothetical protein
MDRNDSLTGVWQGLYSYPPEAKMRESHFVATLFDTGGLLGGTIHENMNRLNGSVTPANASVDGRCDGDHVHFVKSYDGTGCLTHQVHYDGVLNADRTKVEGTWTIFSIRWGRQGGRFLMVRDRPLASAAKAEAFEKA